jgi:hypothetical protein
MGGEVLKVSIGLEVEAFELRDPNRSSNVSPHGSSIHLNYSSGCSDEFWRPQKLDHQLMVWSLSPLGCQSTSLGTLAVFLMCPLTKDSRRLSR